MTDVPYSTLYPEASMTHLQSFNLFSALPTELRLKIFQYIEHHYTFPDTAASSETTLNLHILKIAYSPSLCRYISNTAPPITLSICKESREQTLLNWNHLSLGPIPSRDPQPPATIKSIKKTATNPPRATLAYQNPLQSNSPYHSPSSQPHTKAVVTQSAPLQPPTISAIPIAYPTTILYISSLSLLLSTMHFQHTFLFHLSTSPSRHLLQWLAVDLRVWTELCEHGFLGVLARMRGLKGVRLVVEFGRSFTGPLGFHPSPAWRTDLQYLAKQAKREIERIRSSLRDIKRSTSVIAQGNDEMGDVDVQCVILTKGGEHA